MADNSTFVKITNKDIYEKQEKMDKKLDKIIGKQEAHDILFKIGAVLLTILTTILGEHIIGR